MNNFDDILNTGSKGQVDNKEAFIVESKKNREYCFELLDVMAAQVVTSQSEYKGFLDVQSRFSRYTANNALLIMAQKPQASKLADFKYWRDKGNYIKKQEMTKPVLILEPGEQYERKDGGVGTFYNAKKVYDISQTTAREKVKPSVDERTLIQALINNAPVLLKTVNPDQQALQNGAIYVPEDRCIYIHQGMDGQEIFRSVATELAHVELADGNKSYDRTVNELHAKSTAYILCRENGVDIRGFDFNEVETRLGSNEPKEVRKELAKIHDAAGEISNRMYKVLEQAKNDRKHEQQER